MKLSKKLKKRTKKIEKAVSRLSKEKQAELLQKLTALFK